MADETFDGTQPIPAVQPVTIKPEAVEPQKQKIDENVSNLPYHTKETEKIAEDRKGDAKANQDKPYEYTANGYTVTEEKLEDEKTLLGAVDGKVYKVTADGGFEKVFTSKRDAEIYANTHAEAHKDLPATISKS